MVSGNLASIKARRKWIKENYAKYKARTDAYHKRNRKRRAEQGKARYHFTRDAVLNAIHTSDPESLFYEEP